MNAWNEAKIKTEYVISTQNLLDTCARQDLLGSWRYIAVRFPSSIQLENKLEWTY